MGVVGIFCARSLSPWRKNSSVTRMAHFLAIGNGFNTVHAQPISSSVHNPSHMYRICFFMNMYHMYRIFFYVYVSFFYVYVSMRKSFVILISLSYIHISVDLYISNIIYKLALDHLICTSPLDFVDVIISQHHVSLTHSLSLFPLWVLRN
jgi:hypothetical protein